LWSYIDVYDLTDAIVLAVESDLPGHEVFYIASPDNAGGRPFGEILKEYYGDEIALKEPLPREDASGISIEKARRMLGYDPQRSGATTSTRTARPSPGSAEAPLG
jgi:UDP-glucose 4-epimerase